MIFETNDRHKTYFDSTGIRVKRQRINSDRKVESKTLYKKNIDTTISIRYTYKDEVDEVIIQIHNNSSKIIKSSKYKIESNDTMRTDIWTYEYKYDTLELKAFLDNYYKGNLVSQATYHNKYNEKDKLIESYNIRSDKLGISEPQNLTKYFYLDNGKLDYILHPNKDSKTKYIYDENSVIEKFVNDYIEYEDKRTWYDERGNKIKSSGVDLSTWYYDYDDSNNLMFKYKEFIPFLFQFGTIYEYEYYD